LSAASAPRLALTCAARSCAPSAAQAGNASCAAATAARACSSEAAPAKPTTVCGSAGSWTAKLSAASCRAPAMNRPVLISGSVSVMPAS
jgi:hypothetical protein